MTRSDLEFQFSSRLTTLELVIKESIEVKATIQPVVDKLCERYNLTNDSLSSVIAQIKMLTSAQYSTGKLRGELDFLNNTITEINAAIARKGRRRSPDYNRHRAS